MKNQVLKIVVTSILIFSIAAVILIFKGVSEIEHYFADNLTVQTSNLEKPKFLVSITGSGNNKLMEPINVIINDEGHIIVSDKGSYQVKIFNEKGKYVRSIGMKGSKDGQFLYPYGLVTTSEGNIWVSDSENNTVQQFDIKGNLTKVITSDETVKPGLMTKDKLNNIYISDLSGKRILVYNEAGEKVDEIKGNFSFPQGLAMTSDDQLWVGDAGKVSSLKSFSLDGILQKQSVQDEKKKPYFKALRGIARDSKDKIYVNDPMANKVLVFNSMGNFLFTFGSSGVGDNQLNRPTGIFVDGENRIYIADRFNKRIQVWGY